MRMIEAKRTQDLWGLPQRMSYVYGTVAALLLASALLPVKLLTEGPVLCLFRRITDHPCPGCGLTRSFVATAHLRLEEAFSQHLFGPLVFVGLLVAVASRWMLAKSTVSWFPRGPWASRSIRVLVLGWLVWAGLRLAGSIWGW